MNVRGDPTHWTSSLNEEDQGSPYLVIQATFQMVEISRGRRTEGLNPKGEGCDVASFSDYSRLETAKRDSCCPENRAICSDVWKRHSLAPATRHMNTQDQGRRQQETHTPTAKTIYRRNVRSPTTRHRIRNEKRARNQREFHYTSSDVLSDISDPIRHFISILIYPTQRSSPKGSLVHV